MTGGFALLGGSDDAGNTWTETEMSDEQVAALQFRQGMVADYLYPFANATRRRQGLGDIPYGAPGWDEEVRRGGIGYFTGLEGNNPWALSDESRQWLGSTQDYIGRASRGLETNPFGGGAGGWDNPNLARITGGYGDLAGTLAGGFDTRMGNLLGEYGGQIDRFSQAPNVEFTPEMFDYANAVTGEGIKMDLSLLGGGASGGVATGAEVGAIDEAATVARAQELFRDVVTPGMTAAASSAGVGRSGAELEAMSARGKEIALPISQQVLKHASDAALTTAKLATDASIATAGYATQASVANAQVRGRIAEMDYLQRATGALQAQALTAKSDAQRQQIMAEVATLNAELRYKSQALGADMSKYGLGVGAHGAESGFGTSSDLLKYGYGQEMGAYGAGADWAMKAPGAITGLMGMGLAASEYGPNLARTDQERQQQFFLNLMGMNPMPGGGKVTSGINKGNFADQFHGMFNEYAGLFTDFIGAGGGAMMMSTRRLKTDITEIPAQDQVAADVLALPVKSWRYQWEAPERRHLGPILEESPRYLHADETHLDVSSMFGALILTTQALDRRLRALEGAK